MQLTAPFRLLPLTALATALVATSVADATAQVTTRAPDHRSALELSATAEHLGVVTYSEPIDLRRHALWNDPDALPDLRTLRIAGSVRNDGDAAVRVIVFAIAEAEYMSLVRDRRRAVRSVPMVWFDVDANAVGELSRLAPRDPAGLGRLMRAGPVRLGMVVESLVPGARIRIGAEGGELGAIAPLSPVLTSRNGTVSLVDAHTLAADAFLTGAVHPLGSRYDPSVAGSSARPHQRPR